MTCPPEEAPSAPTRKKEKEERDDSITCPTRGAKGRELRKALTGVFIKTVRKRKGASPKSKKRGGKVVEGENSCEGAGGNVKE